MGFTFFTPDVVRVRVGLDEADDAAAVDVMADDAAVVEFVASSASAVSLTDRSSGLSCSGSFMLCVLQVLYSSLSISRHDLESYVVRLVPGEDGVRFLLRH